MSKKACDISRQLSENGEIRMHKYNSFKTQHHKITERLLDTSRFSRCTEVNVQENHRLHIGANKYVYLLNHKTSEVCSLVSKHVKYFIVTWPTHVEDILTLQWIRIKASVCASELRLSMRFVKTCSRIIAVNV